MTIVRSPRKERNFTILSNEVCRDSRLSMKALGLLVRLLSRPDNWRTNSESLAREFSVGRDQVRTVLSELRDFGYMQLVKSQNQSGQWITTWYVFDEPNEVQPNLEPEPENQGVGFPYSGESGAITRTDLTSTDNKASAFSKPVKQHSDPARQTEAILYFETFWKQYPRKDGKVAARKAFLSKRIGSMSELNKIIDALNEHKKRWDNPKYIPHASSWINGERWEDEIQSSMSADQLAYERMMGRA